jgi:hypothetical protein
LLFLLARDKLVTTIRGALTSDCIAAFAGFRFGIVNGLFFWPRDKLVMIIGGKLVIIIGGATLLPLLSVLLDNTPELNGDELNGGGVDRDELTDRLELLELRLEMFWRGRGLRDNGIGCDENNVVLELLLELLELEIVLLNNTVLLLLLFFLCFSVLRFDAKLRGAFRFDAGSPLPLLTILLDITIYKLYLISLSAILY